MWFNSTFLQRSLLVSMQCFQANRLDTWTIEWHLHSPDLNFQILESGNSYMEILYPKFTQISKEK